MLSLLVWLKVITLSSSLLYLNFQLEWLNIGQNAITSLPRVFGNLTRLFHLDLSCNKLDLDGIPTSFFSIASLERLYLSDNSIECLVKEFSRFSNLRILALRFYHLVVCTFTWYFRIWRTNIKESVSGITIYFIHRKCLLHVK